MKLQVVQTAPSQVVADWFIVGHWENEPLSGPVQDLDGILGGLLSRLRERGDITGKVGSLTPLYSVTNLASQRLLLVGLGPKAKADVRSLIACASSAAKSLTTKETQALALAVPEPPEGITPEVMTYAMGIGLQQGSEGAGLRKNTRDRFPPREIMLVVQGQGMGLTAAGLRAEIEGRAVSLARELVNLPPCDLFPETFAQRAVQSAQAAGVNCEVFDEARLLAERMGSLLAVARGSERPPRLVVLRYQGAGPGGKTLGLVGKGVTFDSGGLSLKTTEQMLDMKCDMAGAAAVLGAVQAIAECKLPVNVLGILALVENMPSGTAMMLGDVLKARNGKTIEVHNTDAEGRLILADALAYAVDQKVDHLVDLATLTGACMVALGFDVAGLMSNDDPWSQRVLAAARTVGEQAWPLPMFSAFGDMIKSDVADIKNTGGSRMAGAITAAKFLEEFVGKVPWVHLDIAGPAWAEKDNAFRTAGGTGCFVRTLVELARSYGQ